MKNYFVHKNSLCESEKIGAQTKIWSFAHIMKDVKIGKNCNICDGVFIESGVKIGNNVTIKNGVSVWNGVFIEDDVFLGPNCVLTNDLFPRSKVYHSENIKTYIRKGVSIGANATIICGITLGKYSMIGAGSVVTKSVSDFALVVGVPANLRYFITIKGEKLKFDKNSKAKDKEGNIYVLKNNIVKLL